MLAIVCSVTNGNTTSVYICTVVDRYFICNTIQYVYHKFIISDQAMEQEYLIFKFLSKEFSEFHVNCYGVIHVPYPRDEKNE